MDPRVSSLSERPDLLLLAASSLRLHYITSRQDQPSNLPLKPQTSSVLRPSEECWVAQPCSFYEIAALWLILHFPRARLLPQLKLKSLKQNNAPLQFPFQEGDDKTHVKHSNLWLALTASLLVAMMLSQLLPGYA